jgi:hypothetical protein
MKENLLLWLELNDILANNAPLAASTKLAVAK